LARDAAKRQAVDRMPFPYVKPPQAEIFEMGSDEEDQ